MPTHVHARCGLNPDFISRGIYINRQPCAPSIRMSRVRITIFVTRLCRENWYRMKSCLLRNMIAQCLKFLQNMFGKIFEDLGAKAIIIIMFPLLFNPSFFTCRGIQYIHCAGPNCGGMIFTPYVLMWCATPVTKFFHHRQLCIV